MPPIELHDITTVVSKLQSLALRHVLIGGGSLRFVVDARYRATARPTLDIDFAVEVDSLIAYSKLEDQLRKLGFQHDMRPGAPRCRWLVEGIEVDILPSSPDAAEFGSQWFGIALDMSIPHQLKEGLFVNVISATCLMATKLDAFFSRGSNDYYGSRDIEDVVVLLEECSGLLAELESAPKALRKRVANGLRRLLDTPAFLEALPGHLSPESPPQTQARVLLTAKQIGGLVDEIVTAR